MLRLMVVLVAVLPLLLMVAFGCRQAGDPFGSVPADRPACPAVTPTPHFAQLDPARTVNLPAATTLRVGQSLAGEEARWAFAPLARLGPLSSGQNLPRYSMLIGSPADHPDLAALHEQLKSKLPPEAKGSLGPEGYLLAVDAAGVRIVADAPAGAFYGVQTLLQLVGAVGPSEAPASRRPLACPAALIADAPVLPVRGVHVPGGDPSVIPLLERLIGQELPRRKTNLLVMEIRYRFQFQSRPEIKEPTPFSREQIRRLVQLSRQNNVRLVPLLNCFGHQSWLDKNIGALLRAYPEFEERPAGTADYKPKYCRSWCPLNPKVNEVVFDLLDELIDAFDTKDIHLGMDEVLDLGLCPRCKDKSPAELFAKAVNDLHGHVTGRRKARIWIWGDRLIDGFKTPYNAMNGARNGTHPALEMVPKDILLCDWHYHLHETYPSVEQFDKAGFDHVSCSWNKKPAVDAFMKYAANHGGARYRGHLATNWAPVGALLPVMLDQAPRPPAASTTQPDPQAAHQAAVDCFRRGMELAWHGTAAVVPQKPPPPPARPATQPEMY